MTMQLTLQQQQDNQLLQRTEIAGTITFEGATPSNRDVAGEITKVLKANPNLIVIKQIAGKFGHQAARVTAVAYHNQESRKRFEVLTKHLRKKTEEEKKKIDGERKQVPEVKEKAEKEKKKAGEETKKAEERTQRPVKEKAISEKKQGEQ